MSGYHILARRPRTAIGAVEKKPLHIGWWLAGAAVVGAGLWALSSRAASPAALRRRVLIAGLAGAPGCRTPLPEETQHLRVGPPPAVRFDFGDQVDMVPPRDFLSPEDMSQLPDMSSPDLTMPDLVIPPDLYTGCRVCGDMFFHVCTDHCCGVWPECEKRD